MILILVIANVVFVVAFGRAILDRMCGLGPLEFLNAFGA
jgi:hypothetical protein